LLLITPQQLLNNQNIDILINLLQNQLGKNTFLQIIGSYALTLKRAAQTSQQKLRVSTRDLSDMNRGWGWFLLRRDDPIFDDPQYLSLFLTQSDVTGLGVDTGDPSGVNRIFNKAWKKVVPANVDTPLAFTLTGSDANNLLYSLAQHVARDIHGKRSRQVELMFFGGMYGGGRGRIGGATSVVREFVSGVPKLKMLEIPSPHSPFWKPTSVMEIERLEVIENQALRKIEGNVSKGVIPIGGILIEPIIGANGVYFYRPEFLIKLRHLCDRLRIPIIADEVLTGGGRTGKFFAYQHYEEFEPDFITFGKGLQVAGIAAVKRKGFNSFKFPDMLVTLSSYTEPLLKAAQILSKIADDDLVENAQRMGAYLLQKLQAREKRLNLPLLPRNRSRGKGLLLSVPYEVAEVLDIQIRYGRLLPVLDITSDEIDSLIP